MATKLYSLYHTCDIYNITEDYRGERTKSILASSVACDFFESSGQIKIAQGEYVEYDAYLHMAADNTVQKGMFIAINSKNYLIEYAGHTPDYLGVVSMQFVALKESYAV